VRIKLTIYKRSCVPASSSTCPFPPRKPKPYNYSYKCKKVKRNSLFFYVGTLDLHNCEIIQFGAAGAPSFSSIKKTYIFEQKLWIAPMYNNNMIIHRKFVLGIFCAIIYFLSVELVKSGISGTPPE
jgi:hypothetical protein